MQDSELDSFYLKNETNLIQLQEEYQSDLNDLDSVREQSQYSYEDRHSYWPGKTRDLKKSGPDAMPWEGASDQEVFLIEQTISSYVALCMIAYQRSQIRAMPIEASDVRTSRTIGKFLKWLKDTGIPNMRQHMELAANYLYEKGMVAVYVDYDRKLPKGKLKINLEELAEVSPEAADMVADESREDEFIQLLSDQFESVNRKRAKKALKELRDTGEAEIPIVRAESSNPCVLTREVGADVIFPPYVMDLQKSPRISMRVLMTPQEIENAVATEGWDEEWAETVIEKYRGVADSQIDSPAGSENSQTSRTTTQYGARSGGEDLVEVIYTWRRLIDEEDGSEGIYKTVWHPEYTDRSAVHDLIEDIQEYPFVFARISESHKRIQDNITFPEMLRGPQRHIKTTLDGRTDQMSIGIAPPFLHPVGRAPDTIGANAWIGVRPNDRFEFMQVPSSSREGIQVEEYAWKRALDLVGLDPENPDSANRKQYYVNKFLVLVRDVLKKAYDMYVLYGDDELQFRVTGSPEAVSIARDELIAKLDVIVEFDTLMADPDVAEKKIQSIVNLLQLDADGTIDRNALMEIAVNMIDPSIADLVLRPVEAGREDVIRKVSEDLTKIASGQAVGAQPNGASVAIEYIDQYASQPDIAQKLAADEAWLERLSTYRQQYTFQIEQYQQNAQIGRIGTKPAQVGQTQTQDLNAE